MKNYEIVTNNLGASIVVLIEGDKITSIPMDEANSDYQAYLEYIAENPVEDVE